MSDNSIILYAQVVLIAPSGKDISREQLITTRNIDMLLPSRHTLQQAAIILTQAGFGCSETTPTLSISGSPALFEDFFRMKLSSSTHSGKPPRVEKKATIPASLKGLVSSIEFGEPMELFN